MSMRMVKRTFRQLLALLEGRPPLNGRDGPAIIHWAASRYRRSVGTSLD